MGFPTYRAAILWEMPPVGRGHRFEVDRDLLAAMYVDQKMSMRDIGESLGCSYSTVQARLIEYGITRRSWAEAGSLWKRTAESNARRSKAHMKLWDKRGRRTPEHALHLQRSEWKQRAKECYERDQWLCQDCGVHCDGRPGATKIQCHHVIPRSLGGGDELSNLVTLCNACHKTREWRHDGAMIV